MALKVLFKNLCGVPMIHFDETYWIRNGNVQLFYHRRFTNKKLFKNIKT